MTASLNSSTRKPVLRSSIMSSSFGTVKSTSKPLACDIAKAKTGFPAVSRNVPSDTDKNVFTISVLRNVCCLIAFRSNELKLILT